MSTGVKRTIDNQNSIETLSAGNILLDDGTATVPALAFNADPDTGLYRESGGIAFSTNGAKRVRINDGTVDFTVPLIAPQGSASACSYSFNSDGNTGMYSTAADSITLCTAGANRINLSAGSADFNQPIRMYVNGTAAAPLYSFGPDTDTGIWHSADNNIDFSVGGTNRLNMTASTITSTLPLALPVGSAAAPALRFDADTGIYSTGDGNVSITNNGSQRINVSPTFTESYNTIVAPVGSAAQSGFCFNGDSSTGLYRSAASNVDIATAGVNRFNINSTALTTTVPQRTALGSVSAPAYSFSGDTNTGVYSSAGDTLDFSTGGVHALKIANDQKIASDKQFSVLDTTDTTAFDTGTIITQGGISCRKHLICNSFQVGSGGTTISTLVDNTGWTPSFRGSGNGNLFTNVGTNGYYTRIGKLVYAYGFLDWSSQNGATGNVQIVPPSVGSTFRGGGHILSNNVAIANTGIAPSHTDISFVAHDSAYFDMKRNLNTGSGFIGTNITVSDLPASGTIIFFIQFIIQS